MTSLSAWSPQRYSSRKTQSGGSVASAWQCLWACAWRGWTVTRPSLTTQPWLPWALTWHTRFDGFIYIFSTWKFLIRNHSAFQSLAENPPGTLKKKKKNPVNFWKDRLKASDKGLLLPSTFCRTLLRRLWWSTGCSIQSVSNPKNCLAFSCNLKANIFFLLLIAAAARSTSIPSTILQFLLFWHNSSCVRCTWCETAVSVCYGCSLNLWDEVVCYIKHTLDRDLVFLVCGILYNSYMKMSVVCCISQRELTLPQGNYVVLWALELQTGFQQCNKGFCGFLTTPCCRW